MSGANLTVGAIAPTDATLIFLLVDPYQDSLAGAMV